MECSRDFKRTSLLVALGLVIVLTITGQAWMGGELPALTKGADRLAALQNPDGGWGWPLSGSSAPNTVGPIAMGLAQAYRSTQGSTHYSALIAAGAFLLAKTDTFSPSDGYLAAQLDRVFGVTTYSNHVKTFFYDKLAAGTYNRNGLGTLYNTAQYVERIRTSRASQGIANLAAWDIGMGLVGAASVGADTSAWIAGTKAEINELDGSNYYDVIGLAGAIYGLAFVHEDVDPTAGQHSAASSLIDLADILASYQLASGGFAWNSNYVVENESNESNQETAYSALALHAVSRVSARSYAVNALKAREYLISVQLSTGGWDGYPGDPYGENNELTGEALWAIAEVVTTPGHMIGEGFVVKDRDRYHFNFNVSEGARREWRNGFRLRVDYEGHVGGDSKGKPNRVKKADDDFVATSISFVAFSDDPNHKPGHSPKPEVDTVLFSGTGKWNRNAVCNFEVKAADYGEPGRKRETFSVRIYGGAGCPAPEINVAGTLSGGNIQSVRIKH